APQVDPTGLIRLEIELVDSPGLDLGEAPGAQRVDGLERLLADPTGGLWIKPQPGQDSGPRIARLGQQGAELAVLGAPGETRDHPQARLPDLTLVFGELEEQDAEAGIPIVWLLRCDSSQVDGDKRSQRLRAAKMLLRCFGPTTPTRARRPFDASVD